MVDGEDVVFGVSENVGSGDHDYFVIVVLSAVVVELDVGDCVVGF